MNNPENNPKEGLFSHTDDYNRLAEVTRQFPSIQEIEINNKEHYESLIQITNSDNDMIPLFLKDDDSEFHIISSHNTDIENVGENCKLVYLGKPFDVEVVASED
jgi:hypothetical protein